jgi:hypothetical protein
MRFRGSCLAVLALLALAVAPVQAADDVPVPVQCDVQEVALAAPDVPSTYVLSGATAVAAVTSNANECVPTSFVQPAQAAVHTARSWRPPVASTFLTSMHVPPSLS